MIFSYDLLTPKPLVRLTKDNMRFYKREDTGIIYPSVTSVLSKRWDHSSLDKWRDRVGHKQADEIASSAAKKGTAMHDIFEKYLLGDFAATKKGPIPAKYALKQAKPYFNRHVRLIRGIEFPLNSDKLWTAGTADLIAEWDGVLSIIDFKSSKYEKNEDHIIHYFIQSTTYGLMLYEQFGIIPKQIVIMVIPDHSQPQIIKKPITEYMDVAMPLFKSFKEEFFEHYNKGCTPQ